ncbi:MAG: hypothetical protein WBN11_00735 [Eudoraea sp.]|uniref:hypothetical protein n=1 Tax=Eudoraea sp. TaxID=1979955 RepID=UPI003C740CB8
MKKALTFLVLCVLSFQFAKAQNITTHQYRKVAPENMQEYLKRETTYWAKWAEKEVAKGNMTFWAILQRVGGVNQDTSPNILIINTFKNIDKGADWASIDAMFPDVKMADIGTGDISTNMHQIFLSDLPNHLRAENTGNDDYKYVRIIYHDTKNLGQHLAFESEKWKPMVEQAMKDGKTTMKGWGNQTIISPVTSTFTYGSYSYDIFSSMQDALSPAFSADNTMPDGFWDGFQENYNKRNSNLYRVVAGVSQPAE